MAYKNTKLEAEGAEFLVLGNLLISGIATYKTYTNMPGYDLAAQSPEASPATCLLTIRVLSAMCSWAHS